MILVLFIIITCTIQIITGYKLKEDLIRWQYNQSDSEINFQKAGYEEKQQRSTGSNF